MRLELKEWEFCRCWLNSTDEYGQAIGVALSLQPTSFFIRRMEISPIISLFHTNLLHILFEFITVHDSDISDTRTVVVDSVCRTM